MKNLILQDFLLNDLDVKLSEDREEPWTRKPTEIGEFIISEEDFFIKFKNQDEGNTVNTVWQAVKKFYSQLKDVKVFEQAESLAVEIDNSNDFPILIFVSIDVYRFKEFRVTANIW